MADSTAPRVLLVDDHTMLREGLRRTLGGQGFDIVGEASDGREAIDAATALRPQVILMDVTMPVLGGIEAAKRIMVSHPDMRIVMLTMHADAQLVRDALAAGASGYLVKDCATADIVDAIHRSLRNEQVFPSQAAIATSERPPDAPRLITGREAEVLQLIANGKSTTEAAAELFVSVKTVKNHLASAYAKLDAHDRTQAVLRAARLGLISLVE